MVKLRLKRMGKRHYPVYKIVAADSRFPRDGRFIESVGLYNPNTQPMEVSLDESRVLYWLNVGAQPTDTVKSLLKNEGVMIKFHLTKKGTEAAAIDAEVEKHLTDRDARLKRAIEKKVRRKANKKTKKAEEAAAAAPKEVKAAPPAQVVAEKTEAAPEKTAEPVTEKIDAPVEAAVEKTEEAVAEKTETPVEAAAEKTDEVVAEKTETPVEAAAEKTEEVVAEKTETPAETTEEPKAETPAKDATEKSAE